jgi:GNAT superfamily N-acetyltransferase
MNAYTNRIIREATAADIHLIHTLAHAVWPITYENILSSVQLQYMLKMIYSEAALQKQFNEGHHFLIVEEDGIAVAFADYSLLKNDVYKLNKIYVLPDQQGKGTGKFLVDAVIDKVKQANALSLLLNVNRHNKAKAFYEYLGFKVIGEEDIDIGEGFFMNDYVMQLNL